jgi:condensin-2 complex subunit D3
MATCLQDKNPMVRRHALILLTQLILQDFLKWRGMLLFRFLATAADNDSEMSEFAKTLLKNTLRSKYPDFFAHHFAECVVVFNGYVDHPTYVAAASSGSEGGSCPVTMEGVDLEGRNRRSARLKLYAMMMEDFSEEQKIAVSAKLVQDIVGHFVDAASSRKGENDVSGAMEEALEDALIILQSPLLKVGRKTNENGEEDGGEDEGGIITPLKSKSLTPSATSTAL